MPFANPLFGLSGALVASSVHSPNYVAGTSGWSIKKDGTAEFQALTSRGDVITNQIDWATGVSYSASLTALMAAFQAMRKERSYGNAVSTSTSTASVVDISSTFTNGPIVIGGYSAQSPLFSHTSRYEIKAMLDLQPASAPPGAFICELYVDIGAGPVAQPDQLVFMPTTTERVTLFKFWEILNNNNTLATLSLRIHHLGSVAYSVRNPHSTWQMIHADSFVGELT